MKKGDMVFFERATLHGPKKSLGKVDFIRDDGRIEVRGWDGGIYTRDKSELTPKEERDNCCTL